MKNAMSLKGLVKNKAKELNVPAQLVLQNYFHERLIERISRSKYRKNFIIKGGYLIGIKGDSHFIITPQCKILNE